MIKSLPSKSYGFTLIELIVVIGIIGILATFAIPKFESTVDNFKLSIACEQIAKHILLARERAVSESKTIRIVFDLDSKDSYQVLNSIHGIKYTLPSGITFCYTNFPSNTVEFYPSGVPSQGGTIAIKGKSKTLYIIVTPVTARVRISDSPPTN